MTYITRIDLDNAEIEDLIDGKSEENLFAWRLYDHIQERTYLFTHRTPLEKIQILEALEYERAYVEENSSKDCENPFYTRITTLKTEPYLTDQSSRSFSSITKRSKTFSFQTSEIHVFFYLQSIVQYRPFFEQVFRHVAIKHHLF